MATVPTFDEHCINVLAEANGVQDGNLSASFLAALDTPEPCNLDVKPTEAMAPRFRWRSDLEKLEKRTTSTYPKLPKSSKEPSEWDSPVNHQVRDLNIKAPWTPLPVFDSRLIEAHAKHAAAFYSGVSSTSPAGDLGGPMETSWKYQHMAFQLPLMLMEALTESMDKTGSTPDKAWHYRKCKALGRPICGCRYPDPTPAGGKAVRASKRPQLAEPSAGEVASLCSSEHDAARARMRTMLTHASSLGYDASMPEHEELLVANPLASIFDKVDQPIGFVSRAEMQYHVGVKHKGLVDAMAAAGYDDLDIRTARGTFGVVRNVEAEGRAAREELLANHRILPPVVRAVAVRPAARRHPATIPDSKGETTPPYSSSEDGEGCSSRKRKLPARFRDGE